MLAPHCDRLTWNVPCLDLRRVAVRVPRGVSSIDIHVNVDGEGGWLEECGEALISKGRAGFPMWVGT